MVLGVLLVFRLWYVYVVVLFLTQKRSRDVLFTKMSCGIKERINI